MKILVTGGTGTISSGIVKECQKCGMKVYAVNRGNHKLRNLDGVTYITADVWNENKIANALRGLSFDVVVECLAYNVEHLKISLNNFGKLCNQYVFISTAGIYSRNNMRIKESDNKDFDNWKYTKDKIECEKFLIEHAKEYDFTYTIIRPVVTYGNYRVPYPVATRNPAWTFFQRMLDGKPMLACENVKFSVIHIDDFSYAVVKLFQNPMAQNEDFHIADQTGEIYWDDVIVEAAKILNVKPLIIHVPLEAFKIMFNEIYEELKWNKSTPMLVDDSKLKNAVTGFHQTIALKEGIFKISEAMRKEADDAGKALDKEWDSKCDTLIYYAYIKKIISDREYKKLGEYYKTVNRKERIRLRLHVLKKKVKFFLKSNMQVLKGYLLSFAK